MSSRPPAPATPVEPAPIAPAAATGRGWRLGGWGWTALSVAGLAAAAWLARAPLAHMALTQILNAQGLSHDFTVTDVDFGAAKLKNLRLGGAAAPDLVAESVEVRFALGLTPRLTAARIDGLRLSGALTDTGLSLGSLDSFLTPTGPAQPIALPALTLTLTDAQITLATPLGQIRAKLQGAGDLGATFTADGAWTGPQGMGGPLAAFTDAAGLHLQAKGTADQFVWVGVRLSRAAGTVQATLAQGAPAPRLSAQAAIGAIDLGALRGADVQVSIAGPLGAGGRLPWSANAARVTSPVLDATGGMRARGEVRLAPAGAAITAVLTADKGLALGAAGRAALVGLAAPDDSPLSPTLRAARSRLVAAADSLTEFEIQAGFSTEDGGVIQVQGLSLRAATGAKLILRPAAARGFALAGPAWRPIGALTAELSGGGVPTLTAAAESDGDLLKGRLAIEAEGEGASAALAIEAAQFDFNAQRYSLDGEATMTGPLAGGRIEALRAPLRLSGRLGDGFSLAPRDACLAVTARRLTAAGGVFETPQLRLCPQGADFLRVAPGGALSGGVAVPGVRLQGRLADTGKPATLAFGGARLSFQGRAAVAQISDLEFSAALEAGDLSARAVGLSARFDAQGFSGALTGGQVDGDALPVSISDASLRFGADGAALALLGGGARVADRRPAEMAPADWRPRFNPLRLENIRGRLDEGLLTTLGDVVLPGRALAGGAGFAPDRRLGGFSAEHRVAANVGAAKVFTQGLIFDRDLDAYDISDPIRGVASGVTGRLDAALDVSWTGGALAAEGAISLDTISFQTAALGQVDGVSGTLRFTDLLALRSAPGQTFTVGKIDPGVGVLDGTIRFQILSPTEVRLEEARWPFAGGALYVNPQLLDLSSRRFELTVQLTEIDLARLIDTLGLPDIAATGQVAGLFPLRFSEEGVEVVDGELISLGPGSLSYTGPISDTLKGPPQVAFDALQAFNFDSLRIGLDGPLASDVTARVEFEGVNAAPLRDMSSLAPLPGLDLGQPVGLPFKYDVSVALPFRQLLGSYQGLVDGRTYVRRYLSGEDFSAPAARPVDPPGSPPR